LSDNSTEKKDRKFFFRRKGEMQGATSALLLPSARIVSNIPAQVPSPPDNVDFFYSALVGLPGTYLKLEVDGVEQTIEFTDSSVSHILQQIETAGFTAEFSNRFLIVTADPAVSYVKVLPYSVPAQDASVLLGFTHGETFSAYSRPDWDSPAPGKNKETFIQQYENNLSSAVNRALSAVSSNLEEQNRFLSDEIAVPKFVNTTENPDILGFDLDAGYYKGLFLRDRAFVGESATQSLASIEKFFVLTDKFGACSITTSDFEEPVRICDVVSGDRDPVIVARTNSYFFNLPGTTQFVSYGDGKSIVGVREQNTEIGLYTAVEVIEGNKIKFAETVEDIYVGCRVLWPAGHRNSGEYIVSEIVTDYIVEVRPTATGVDVLENAPLPNIVVYHSDFIPGADPVNLYLVFDKPVPQSRVLHGFGLLYGARTSVKEFLTTTLMGNLKGQATSDIVIRSLRAIRGPNSDNYRSVRVGDPDGYMANSDTSVDGGDAISLESLASRSLLGRDRFDLTGAGAIPSSLADDPNFYTKVDATKAVVHAPAPLTLYGNIDVTQDAPVDVEQALSINADRWLQRLGGPGPFIDATLIEGRILEKQAAFLPTDVGFTVILAPAEGDFSDAKPEDKPLLRTWTIEKYISPDRVLLSCVDLPTLFTASDEVAVQFTFTDRNPRNVSAGALLRLDKISGDPYGVSAGAKVNALVLTDTSGVTGVVALTRVMHESVDLESKEYFTRVGTGQIRLSTRFKEDYSLVHHLYPASEVTPFLPSLVQVIDLPQPLPAGPWYTGTEAGGFKLLTFTRQPTLGATVAEIVSNDGTFDGMFLVNTVSLDIEGYFVLGLCDFALNQITVPSGTTGTLRLYTLTQASGLRSASRGWGSLVEQSRAHFTYFGTGILPDSAEVESDSVGVLPVVARFAGSGELDTVVEIRTGATTTSNQTGVPRAGLTVWADAPSQGIEVHTRTVDTGDVADVNGGTGLRIVGNTTARAILSRESEVVKPVTAALIASQLYNTLETDSYISDPVNRDPVAIFATQPRPTGIGDDFHPNFAEIETIPAEYDTNAQVVSYVCDDVYQRSDDRAHWSVFIYKDAGNIAASDYVQIYAKSPGYIDYTVSLEGTAAPNKVTVQEVTKNIQINLNYSGANLSYTAAGLVADINSTEDFAAVCSDIGSWRITVDDMPGTGSASEAVAQFTPVSIRQHSLNTAIETIQGDLIVTDGIFAIRENTRITGVGSHLIPLNPEVPLQASIAEVGGSVGDDVGYDLGEEKVRAQGDITIPTGTMRISFEAILPVSETHINRKLTIRRISDSQEITRYITGVDGAEFTLNHPIVFDDWAGNPVNTSVEVTVYGRRWKNIHAQNIIVDTINTSATGVGNFSQVTSEEITTERLTVTGVRRKFIPASDFVRAYEKDLFGGDVEYPYAKFLGSEITNPFVAPYRYYGWANTREPDDDTFFQIVYTFVPEVGAGIHTLEIEEIHVLYKYLGDSPMGPIAFDDTYWKAFVTVIPCDFTPSSIAPEIPENTSWFIGGYNSVITPDGTATPVLRKERVNNDILAVGGFVPPETLSISLSSLGLESGLSHAGFFFRVNIRPQILFHGLLIKYKEVT
jgi:hypothetical protein